METGECGEQDDVERVPQAFKLVRIEKIPAADESSAVLRGAQLKETIRKRRVARKEEPRAKLGRLVSGGNCL